jgi:hypothetical protein
MNRIDEIIEEIEEAKKSKTHYEIYQLFMDYCYYKGIGFYSKKVFDEILVLFPKKENEKLYEYCIWRMNEQE